MHLSQHNESLGEFDYLVQETVLEVKQLLRPLQPERAEPEERRVGNG